MGELARSYGKPIAGLIVLLVAAWILILVVLPQALMIDRSLWWYDDQSSITSELDQAYTELSLADYDLKAATTDAEKQTLAARIGELNAKVATLEAQKSDPVKHYGFANYGRMSGLHFQVFAKTIGYSIMVTLLALVVCYPVAYYVAKLSTPARAAALLVALTIPYAINELLRIYAWLMILDYRGVLNGLLDTLGFVDLDARQWIPFLENPGAVFAAMIYTYVLFMVFPIYNTLETLDSNQIEAARDLGASTWKLHARVVIPHAKPGIAVGCIMTFMLAVGSYSVPQIITRGASGDWFSQLIYRQFFDNNNWNVGSAYAFTLLIACLIFIFLCMLVFKVGIRDVAR